MTLVTGKPIDAVYSKLAELMWFDSYLEMSLLLIKSEIYLPLLLTLLLLTKHIQQSNRRSNIQLLMEYHYQSAVALFVFLSTIVSTEKNTMQTVFID
jgi:uncharacterized paraquat-inducible protein A